MPSDQGARRTVTTVVAIESLVEGDADHNEVAQNVMASITPPNGVVWGDIGARQSAYPRAIRLIESSERITQGLEQSEEGVSR